MDVQFQSERTILSQNVNGKVGDFALDSTPFTLESCRERFAKSFVHDTIGFYVLHKRGYNKNVAAFLLRTESILGIESKSEFATTNRQTILWVQPSMFWKECQMKRSLLTILVRCGNNYFLDEDNYEDALFGHEYIVPTRRAMTRFLFGFTKYVGPDISTESSVQIKGWKSIFDGKSEEVVKSMLIWPNDKGYTPTVEFPKALWW